MTDRSRTVFRFAEWTLGPGRDEDGHAYLPVREVLCETCALHSEPGHGQDQTDKWALRHAGMTGHRSYLEITKAALAARPAPTNPLYDAERDEEQQRP